MKNDRHFTASASALERETGAAIPVYFPPDFDPAAGERILRETAEGFLREVERPEAICLSVDGSGPGEAAAESVARELGLRKVSSAVNRGKLGALRAAMSALLADDRLQYLATVDQDGDHFPNELLNFVRAARHVEATAPTDRVMVLGRRISRHRPMGFLRGELEELADRMLLDALAYDAAATGRPLRLQYATTIEEFPDFHSGYKLFTRRAAEEVFLPPTELAGMPEERVSRHAVEAVLSVEAIRSGAYLSVINRSTLDQQPVSAFGRLNRRQMVADKIIWPCKRLNVPPPFVAQWLRNHLPRLLLLTYAPEGKAELCEIARLVLDAFGLPAGDAESLFTRPEFI